MPFGCALRCVGAARARPLRLPLTADVFDARFGRFLAMSSLPFLNRRRDTRHDGGLAIIASSVALPRSARSLSIIRKRRSLIGHFVVVLDQCVTPLLGKRMVNIDPLPGSLVTVKSPPIMRASLREMARPSPVPPKR